MATYGGSSPPFASRDRLSLSRTTGFPMSEKTEFDRAAGAHYEYQIFVSIYREVQNPTSELWGAPDQR